MRDRSTGDLAAHYVLSLPERALRSATALAAGLVRELGDVALPGSLRRSRLYQHLVEGTLRFLIEQVGEVEDAYPPEGRLAENFALRRAAGNGIEWVGILTFHASPVWVLAALADLSGAGRQLVQEIAGALQQEGLLDRETRFETVDQMLDGLEKTSGRLAETINTPPLDVAGLRREWDEIRRAARSIPRRKLPAPETLRGSWEELRSEAAAQGRPVFQLSAVMGLSAVARVAARRTGELVSAALLDHYRSTLDEIRRTGFLPYWAREFRPYLRAAAAAFSHRRVSLTERFLRNRA